MSGSDHSSRACSSAEVAGTYLREEAPGLVRPAEFEAFGRDIDTLTRTLDELEARLLSIRDKQA